MIRRSRARPWRWRIAMLATFAGMWSPGWTDTAADASASDAQGQAHDDAHDDDDAVLTLTPEHAVMTLGVDTQDTLTIALSGHAIANAAPGRMRASVGTVGELAPSGTRPGLFSAIYRPPPELRPQAVLIGIELVLPNSRRRVRGVTRIRLDAPTRFPLRTSPDAQVTLAVRGHVFGPVTADELGQVFVPIVVPPGVATGTARAVNQFGVAKETVVDLQNLDFPRVLMFADAEGEVGSDSLVEVWAMEATGRPASPEDVDLGVSAGRVRRLTTRSEPARFAVALPNTVGPGKVSLIASLNDGSSTDIAALSLSPAAPAQLAMHADTTLLTIGTESHASVRISVRDRFGNVLEPKGLMAFVDDRPVPVQTAPDLAMVYVPAPPVERVQPRLVVRADLGHLHAAVAIALTGGPPASATLTTNRPMVPGTGHDAAELQLRVRDDKGIPTVATRVDWWSTTPGSIEEIPATDPGDYRARFLPERTVRDLQPTIYASVDDRIAGAVELRVNGVPARTVTARVGVVSNLRTTLGPSVFVDAAWPMRFGRFSSPERPHDLSRIVGLGLSVGYVHTDLTTRSMPSVRVEIDQLPVLALARLRVPVAAPVELFVSWSAGVTFANLSLSPAGTLPAMVSKVTAHGFTIGLGTEAWIPLDPGQLVVGARYLRVDLGRTSEQDRVEGNSLGLICDLGYKLGF